MITFHLSTIFFQNKRKNLKKTLDNWKKILYNNTCKARVQEPFTKGSEEMKNPMATNDQYDKFLETLAQLIEAKAKTVQEAAEIVRDKKIKKDEPVATN